MAKCKASTGSSVKGLNIDVELNTLYFAGNQSDVVPVTGTLAHCVWYSLASKSIISGRYPTSVCSTVTSIKLQKTDCVHELWT